MPVIRLAGQSLVDSEHVVRQHDWPIGMPSRTTKTLPANAPSSLSSSAGKPPSTPSPARCRVPAPPPGLPRFPRRPPSPDYSIIAGYSSIRNTGESRRAARNFAGRIQSPGARWPPRCRRLRSEEHTSELQSPCNLVCRLLLEKKETLADRVLAPESLLCDFPPRWHEFPIPKLRHEPCFKRGALPSASAGGEEAPHCEGGSFFFNDPATTEICPLSLRDALPI